MWFITTDTFDPHPLFVDFFSIIQGPLLFEISSRLKNIAQKKSLSRDFLKINIYIDCERFMSEMHRSGLAW